MTDQPLTFLLSYKAFTATLTASSNLVSTGRAKKPAGTTWVALADSHRNPINSKRLRYVIQNHTDSANRERVKFGTRVARSKTWGGEFAVLKITITETPEEMRWVLQGRLAEPWVTEVKASWNEAHRTHEGCHCVVDLTDITCIGKGGEELLRSMSNEGAQFIASGFYIKDVLEELKNCR